MQTMEQAVGVIGDLFLAPGAVFHQDMAVVFEAEHRFQPGGNIVGEQRDRARGRDGGQQCVAHPVFGDGRAHVFIQRLNGLGPQIFFLVVQGKDTLFGGQVA